MSAAKRQRGRAAGRPGVASAKSCGPAGPRRISLSRRGWERALQARPGRARTHAAPPRPGVARTPKSAGNYTARPRAWLLFCYTPARTRILARSSHGHSATPSGQGVAFQCCGQPTEIVEIIDMCNSLAAQQGKPFTRARAYREIVARLLDCCIGLKRARNQALGRNSRKTGQMLDCCAAAKTIKIQGFIR